MYTLNSLNNFFVKNGNNETLILDKITNRQVILNKTGSEIFEMVTNNIPINDIETHMHENYPNIDIETIKCDIDLVLCLLDLYEIIQYKKEVPKFNIHIAEFYEYKEFSCLLEEENTKWFPSHLTKDYLNPMEMRFKAVNNNEQYAKFDTLIDGVSKSAAISYIPPMNDSNVILLSSIIINAQTTITECIEEFIKLLLYTYGNKEHLKLRIVLDEPSLLENGVFIKALHAQGFQKEAILQWENKDNSVHFITKTLK